MNWFKFTSGQQPFYVDLDRSELARINGDGSLSIYSQSFGYIVVDSPYNAHLREILDGRAQSWTSRGRLVNEVPETTARQQVVKALAKIFAKQKAALDDEWYATLPERMAEALRPRKKRKKRADA